MCNLLFETTSTNKLCYRLFEVFRILLWLGLALYRVAFSRLHKTIAPFLKVKTSVMISTAGSFSSCREFKPSPSKNNI